MGFLIKVYTEGIDYNFCLSYFKRVLIVYIIVLEREESVKSDIFHAFIVLLKQTQPVIVMTSDTDTMEHESVVLSLLQQQVGHLCFLN